MNIEKAKDFLAEISLQGAIAEEIINKSRRDVQSLPNFSTIGENRKEELFQSQVKFRAELINRATEQAIEQKARQRRFRQTVVNYGLSKIWL